MYACGTIGDVRSGFWRTRETMARKLKREMGRERNEYEEDRRNEEKGEDEHHHRLMVGMSFKRREKISLLSKEGRGSD